METTEKLCRFCKKPLTITAVDLGMSPLANSFVAPEAADNMEAFFPLHVYVCDDCWLAQLSEYESPEGIFSDYVYFSSYSDTLLAHARKYTEEMIARFGFDSQSLVMEIASNDGYLLQYFQENNIPVLGIEPARNVADVARNKGIETVVEFFGVELAGQLAGENRKADLLLGNNVLAHVPDINDFVGGMKIVLKPDGILTMEFPHLMRLIERNQFDTIYHEHFSYLSFTTVNRIFAAHGLTLFDVEEIPTHGGSLRIFGRHEENDRLPVRETVPELLAREEREGMTERSYYTSFADKVKATKRNFLKFLIEAKEDNRQVVAYGAPAKGNTLLNYCGVRTDFIDYAVDRSPHKQNTLLPGTHIPVYAPDRVRETRPDYLIILAWNLKDEIMQQMAYVREWGCRFVVAIPEIQVF